MAEGNLGHTPYAHLPGVNWVDEKEEMGLWIVDCALFEWFVCLFVCLLLNVAGGWSNAGGYMMFRQVKEEVEAIDKQ